MASVNGSDISRREFDEQVRLQQESLRRMFGGQMDPAAFDNPETRRAVLDQMVNERVVATETAKRSLWVDDKRLSETILSIPEFQAGGKFSEQQFDNIARSQNPPLTARQFAERIRQSLSLQQIPGAVAESAIVPHALVARLAAIEAEQREVSQAQLPAKQYLAQVQIDPAQVKKILVIDDHEPMRRNVMMILEMEGFKTVSADNGRQGLARAPRVVVTPRSRSARTCERRP